AVPRGHRAAGGGAGDEPPHVAAPGDPGQRRDVALARGGDTRAGQRAARGRRVGAGADAGAATTGAGTAGAGTHPCRVTTGCTQDPRDGERSMTSHEAERGLAGLRVVVNAGPTYEDIDPVR